MKVQPTTMTNGISRRDLMKYGLGAGLMSTVYAQSLFANTNQVRGHIVIVGAGAGGLALASRLSSRLPNAEITVIDSRPQHFYQPGLTMVASGLWRDQELITETERWMPSGLNWVQALATEFDPDNKQIVLNDGNTVRYDYLVVATGLQVNYNDIEGFSREQIGQHGIGCVYDTPDHARKTNDMIQQWIDQGEGRGVFTLAPTPIKCAGAPLKMAFTTLSRLEVTPHRDRFDVDFMAPGDRVFGIDYYNDFVKQRWADQGVERHDFHVLEAVDGPARQAIFSTSNGNSRTVDYDFLHVVPPMSAPDPIRYSALAWQDGPFANEWLEVDPHTLQHPRYPEVFGLGDVIGAPVNKTAASVKMQTPVVADNLIAVMTDNELPARHNGYTSCPLITGIGKAMLVEFGYNGVMLPSFPFIDPKDESWTVWVMKDRMLKPAYYAMLEGHI